jgi:hypothetical protein
MSADPGSYPDPAGSSYFSGPAVASAAPQELQRLPGQLPEPSSKRRGLLIGGGAIVVAAAVAVTLMLQSGGSVYKRTHVSLPKSAAGFTRVAELNSKVSGSFAQQVPFSGAQIGAYASADGTPAVMVAAAHVKTAPADFAKALNEAKTSGSTTDLEHRPLDLSGLGNAAPGPLGGQMQCGILESDGSSVAACIFVDEGAQGLLFVDNASTVDPALMLRLRSAIEKRS